MVHASPKVSTTGNRDLVTRNCLMPFNRMLKRISRLGAECGRSGVWFVISVLSDHIQVSSTIDKAGFISGHRVCDQAFIVWND